MAHPGSRSVVIVGARTHLTSNTPGASSTRCRFENDTPDRATALVCYPDTGTRQTHAAKTTAKATQPTILRGHSDTPRLSLGTRTLPVAAPALSSHRTATFTEPVRCASIPGSVPILCVKRLNLGQPQQVGRTARRTSLQPRDRWPLNHPGPCEAGSRHKMAHAPSWPGQVYPPAPPRQAGGHSRGGLHWAPFGRR